MKSTREIFKNNPSLLQEPEVIELLEYCEELETEIIEFKFEKSNSKELAMVDMLQEVLKDAMTWKKNRWNMTVSGIKRRNIRKQF